MDTVKNAVEHVVLPFIDALSHERGELRGYLPDYLLLSLNGSY